MDIGESVFRAWLRHKRRKEDSRRPPRLPVLLKNRRGWLVALGILLRGDIPDIRGGSLRDEPSSFYLFPDELLELETEEDDELLLLYRLLYFTESEKRQIFLPEYAGGLGDQLIFSILTQPAIARGVEERYPPARFLREQVHSLLLLTRPRLTEVRSTSDCVELAIQQRLGAGPQSVSFRSPALADFLEKLIYEPEMSMVEPAFSNLRAQGGSLTRAALRPVPLWGVFRAPNMETPAAGSAPNPERRGQSNHEVELGRTVRLRKQKELRKPANPLFHSFEKTESVEDYQGESNPAEAAEDLKEDEEALRDLSLGHVVRTFDQTPGLLRAEIADDPAGFMIASEAALSERVFGYPEWDFRSKSYRDDWCRVYETRIGAPAAVSPKISAVVRRAQPQIREIRRTLLRLLSERTVKNRQLDGPDVDLDSMVERHANLCAGTTPPERLYTSDRLVMKDISMIILFDTSLSTDGWVQGRRVLDVELESILILACAFERLFDNEICVAHFNSSTRNRCQFGVLKSFADPWHRVLETSGEIESFGYTRIGPAIRHATGLLREVRARRKFLLVVSDGKPTDYDQYEGRYGIADVAQAVREAKQFAVTTFGLAVEHQPKHYLAEMFGSGRFHILPKSDLLPAYMANIFLEAVR